MERLFSWKACLVKCWMLFISRGRIRFEFNGLGEYRVSDGDKTVIITDDLEQAMTKLELLDYRVFCETSDLLQKQARTR